MPYVRKTVDVYILEVKYDNQNGWEEELEESNFYDARIQRLTYRANCPQYPCRIKRKRKPRAEFSENYFTERSKAIETGPARLQAEKLKHKK